MKFFAFLGFLSLASLGAAQTGPAIVSPITFRSTSTSRSTRTRTTTSSTTSMTSAMSTTSSSTLSTLTTVVSVFVTYCATTTTFTINGVCYSATTPGQYITVTDCPCTVQSVCTTPYQTGGTAIITAALVSPVGVNPYTAIATAAPAAVTPAQPATSKYVTVSGAPQMTAFMTSFLALLPLIFALIL